MSRSRHAVAFGRSPSSTEEFLPGPEESSPSSPPHQARHAMASTRARVSVCAMLAMALDGLGVAMTKASQTFLIEQALCRAFYTAHDPKIVGPDGDVPEAMCKTEPLQSQVAFLSALLDFSILITCFLVGPIYTRLASVVGKRNVLLINTTSFALRMAWMATFNLLTAILIGTMSLGSFIGASLLDVNAFIICGLIVAVYVALIPLVALFPSDDPAANRIDDTDDGSVEERSSLMPANSPATSVPPSVSSSPVAGLGSGVEAHKPPEEPAPTVLHALLRTVTVDLRYSIELVIQTVRHPFTRRVMLLYFGSTLAMCISLVTPQWASGTFHTGLSNVAKVTAMEQIVSAVTLLALPVLTKFVLYPRLRAKEVVDFWVIVASLLASIVGTLVIATAPSLIIYAVGVAIAATGMGLSDALRSFATTALANKELVQMLYMSIRTVQTLAALIGMPLCHIIEKICQGDSRRPPDHGIGNTFFATGDTDKGGICATPGNSALGTNGGPSALIFSWTHRRLQQTRIHFTELHRLHLTWAFNAPGFCRTSSASA
ncbi:uncharacterized protein C8A04DRAFT_34063 [Dichotomopilus funicola]|uniref:Uncharacterized protein n=1 Tax=Dichotomopilus funicola TaxID=1934379 RepID=A0AAN6VA82_9PEZI|nr:hypothetical protein C8A04DRAFT_34063 [Dichotomopilus funicola]